MTLPAIIMAGFGYLILLGLTIYVIKQAFTAIRLSLAFSGKLTGEVYFIFIAALVLIGLSYYLFPFQVVLNVVPISVK